MLLVRIISLIALLLSSTPAQALRMRICTDTQPHPPLVSHDRSGSVDKLLIAAAAEAGIELDFHAAPLTRCKEEVRLNQSQALPAAADLPPFNTLIEVPRKDGLADTSRAVIDVRTLVYRRSGSAVGWDGKRFSKLTTPVLVQFGVAVGKMRLQRMGLPVDESGKSLEANFLKLMARRADVALGFSFDGDGLLARPEFAGKIEALPLPFTDDAMYFGVSKAYYQANRDAVERMWDAIGRLRAPAAAKPQASPPKR